MDAIVSTIGFPLVGGPAGSMEAGRREEVAQRILRAKNVPYLVSAPLLIQDIHSWTRQGIGGLQSVVLYALPELDGAIDPVPLGGLVGERILPDPRSGAAAHRALCAIGSSCAASPRPSGASPSCSTDFPPATAPSARQPCCRFPHSLINLLLALQQQGYDLGEDLPPMERI